MSFVNVTQIIMFVDIFHLIVIVNMCFLFIIKKRNSQKASTLATSYSVHLPCWQTNGWKHVFFEGDRDLSCYLKKTSLRVSQTIWHFPFFSDAFEFRNVKIIVENQWNETVVWNYSSMSATRHKVFFSSFLFVTWISYVV